MLHQVPPLASKGFALDFVAVTQALVAQRIEHLTTDQKARGSNPFGRTQCLDSQFYCEFKIS